MKKVMLIICMLCLSLCAPSQADTDNPRVVMKAYFVDSDIIVELFPNDAPVTVDNFLHYVNTGFYDDTIIHRTVTQSQGGIGICQGGGFYVDSQEVRKKTPDRPDIVNESYNDLSNTEGTIAMARTSEGPDTANSQFYFNQTDNPGLDKVNNPDGYGYCVFGEVLRGTGFIDYITYLPHYDPIYVEIPNDPNLWLREVPRYHAPNGHDYPIYIWDVFQAPDGYWFRADINYDGIVDEWDLGVINSAWLSTAELGDIEVAGNVDFAEFAQLARSWKRTSPWYRQFAADIDNNKKVDFADFSLFARDWGKNGVELYGDLNIDGSVDYLDLSLFADDWLKQTN